MHFNGRRSCNVYSSLVWIDRGSSEAEFLNKGFNQRSQSDWRGDFDSLLDFIADNAIRASLKYECLGTETRLTHILKVVVQGVVAAWKTFDSLSHTMGWYESIGWCNRRDDVLNNAHSELISHSLNAEGVRSFKSSIVKPFHVNRWILVDSAWRKLLGPLHYESICNTVLRNSRSISYGAGWITHGRWYSSHAAFEAPRFKWYNNSWLSLEAFCSSVNERNLSPLNDASIIFEFHHSVDHWVQPSSCFNIIKACNDAMELLVELQVKLLDLRGVRCNFDTRASLHDKLCCYLWFILANIILSKSIFY